MEAHLKVYRAHRALSLLYGLLLLAFLALALSADPVDVSMLAFGLIVGGAVLAAHVFAARGAKAGNPSTRMLSTAIAVLMLLGFPIGTLIGLYILVYTWKPWPGEELSR